MKTHVQAPQPFEFYFPKMDTLVCVENQPDGVVIRATRATFSEEHKDCFIRELAAEGFIPDACRWTSSALSGNPVIHWLVDRSWCKLSPVATAGTRRFMVRLLAGSTLLWLLLMACVVLGSEQRDLSSAPHQTSLLAAHG